MEKSGWDKFVKDNALGHSEFLTFTHKGKMCFTVNIFKQNGKEMLQPSHSRAFLASSNDETGRVKTEQRRGSVYNDVKKEEALSPELSNRSPTTVVESNGGESYKRKLSFGKKKAEETQNSKRTEKVVRARRDSAEASSSSVSEFTILFKKANQIFQRIPVSFAKDHMPEEKTMFKIHHQDGKKSWNVIYLMKFRSFSGGWRSVVKEYPLDPGDTCKFTLIEPNELLLVVFKP